MNGDENLNLVTFGNYAQFFGLFAAAGFYAQGTFGDNAQSRQTAARLVESFAWTLAVVYPLKYAIGRQRPHDTDDRFETTPGEHLSFPSGHTAIAFAAATTLTLQYPYWEVAVPAYGLAGVTGASRLMGNRHWLSDVTAGAMIGTAVSVLLYRWHQRPASPSAWILHPTSDGLCLQRRF